MTLLVRDEEDIVDAHLRYHLEHGVDFVVATDHRSVDGTTDVLRRYESDGVLHLIREESEQLRQAEWVTRMARLAATDFAADWVVNSDVDEFLWPREATLRELLDIVPRRFGVVFGFWRHFVMRPETAAPFHERMTVRTQPSRAKFSPYVGALKAIHRADPHVVVGRGNHKARGRGLVPLREWTPVEVLHFPIRTQAQLERKYRRVQAGLPLDIGLARHQNAAVRAFDEHGVESVASGLLVDDDTLAAGLADGTLVHDVRLRDALRGAGGPLRPDGSVEDDVRFALESADFPPSDSVARLSWRLDGLARRLEPLERMVAPWRRDGRP